MGILADIQRFTPGQRLELFTVDFSTTGLSVIPPAMYLYSGVKANFGNIVFGGNQYLPWPMQISGLKQSSEGPLPRPVVTVSNVDGFMSQQMMDYNDFIGAKVTRYQTFAKYLDGEPEADPNARQTEVYFVEQKKSETNTAVQLLLASAIDVMDAKLPARVMLTNTCLWRYKGTECSWTPSSGRYFDGDDIPTVDPDLDVCGHRLNSCKIRFCNYDEVTGIFSQPNAKLTFGGFPALGRTK